MFSIYFKTDNAAFDGDKTIEITRILRNIVDNVENGSGGGRIRDINGNTIGEWGLMEAKP